MEDLAIKKVSSPSNDTPKEIKAADLEPKKEKSPFSGMDPLILAYMLIFDSVQTARQSAQIQAKDIQTNALQQNSIIDKEAQLNFQTLPWSILHYQKKVQSANGSIIEHVTPWFGGWPATIRYSMKWFTKKAAATALQQFNTANQEVSAVRGVLEDKLTLLRQNSQVSETNLNSTSDEAQQSIQQGGGLMQMLVNLTSQISRI